MNIVKLPQNMKKPVVRDGSVPPGEYGVYVRKMMLQAPNRITALYEVVDTGPLCGLMIWDSFNLEYERGQEMLGEFLAAIGITCEGHELDIGVCEGKALRVTVKHKGQWANVVLHRPESLRKDGEHSLGSGQEPGTRGEQKGEREHDSIF